MYNIIFRYFERVNPRLVSFSWATIWRIVLHCWWQRPSIFHPCWFNFHYVWFVYLFFTVHLYSFYHMIVWTLSTPKVITSNFIADIKDTLLRQTCNEKSRKTNIRRHLSQSKRKLIIIILYLASFRIPNKKYK